MNKLIFVPLLLTGCAVVPPPPGYYEVPMVTVGVHAHAGVGYGVPVVYSYPVVVNRPVIISRPPPPVHRPPAPVHHIEHQSNHDDRR